MRTIMNRMALRLSTRWSPARARWCSSATYKEILTERRPGGVGLITLNREKQLNALTPTLTKELVAAAKEFDADPEIGAIVVTGSGSKAFAAGADIKTMASLSYMDMYKGQIFSELDDLSKVRKPVIAAVNGFALGGGCELAMMCDFIIAADTAKFGQPEITLGTIPGIGGTQRLTRAIGKSKAMDLCLTGRMMDAAEAERSGLVSRIVPADKLMDETMAAAEKIASMSRPAVAMAKEAVNRAFETTLAEGMSVERNLFHSTFALEDRSEGMAAFIEKRKPVNKNR